MRKLVLFAVLFLAFILAAHLVNAYGLSVLPAFIKMNVIRGQKFNVSISVSNPDSNEWTYLIRADDNITDWVSFYMEGQNERISQITVPAATSKDFIASFNIPKDAQNGNYLSTIFVETLYSGSGSQNYTSSLKIKVPITVSLNVIGSQILAGLVKNITVTDIEINRLLRIKTEFKNIGEVVATPRIEGVIKKNGVEIANFMHNTTSVYVGNTSIINAEWDTTGQTVGDYVANVKIYLDFRLLEEENLNFKILDRGTLTAEGIITKVTIPDKTKVGQPIKIEVLFKNTGEMDIIAKIIGEIYQDDDLIDSIEGEETLIETNDEETLTAYFKTENPGDYQFKGNVLYEGKKIQIDSASFIAEPDGTETSINEPMKTTGRLIEGFDPLIVIFVAIITVGILIGIIIKSKFS